MTSDEAPQTTSMITLMAAISCSHTLTNALIFSLFFKLLQYNAYCSYIISIPQSHPLPPQIPSTFPLIHAFSVITIIIVHLFIQIDEYINTIRCTHFVLLMCSCVYS